MSKISIKREQSQVGLSFAEREKFRPQVKNKLLLLLVLLMTAATGAWAQTETLLTTITATAKEQASYSTANVATVSFSYTAQGSSQYLANWGWWGYGWIATVNAADGYTITKCIFYDDANRTATDSEAPFVVETKEGNDKTPIVNDTPIDGGNMWSKGIKKIEVYGYVTPTYSVTLAEDTEDADKWSIEPNTGLKGGETVTATYSGEKKVKSVKAVKKAAPITDLATITADYEAKDGETLTGTLASNVKISIAAGATVTLKDVNITNLGVGYDWAGITCESDATLVLEGTNTVCAGRGSDGYNNYPGIYIAPDKTLTIQGDGTLTAYSNDSQPYGAGIGGGYKIACGNIVINSGTITATGGWDAAGIGGGNSASCGNITINGGTVTATGGNYGAGIGSGAAGENQGSCGNITISGGTVTATGGENAAGIGGGSTNGVCGTITITKGVTSVTATKGANTPNSIGAGDGGQDITVNIENGANVTQK